MLGKTLFSILSISLVTATLPVPSYANETLACAKTTEEEIAGLFDRWNESLATLDPDQVVANYTTNAVLLPTVSNTPRTDSEGLRDYFVDFLEQKPQGVINESTIAIGCNNAYDVGIYTFTLYDEKGNATEAVARYSYVYTYHEGDWLIRHHHSSLMPEPIAETTPETMSKK